MTQDELRRYIEKCEEAGTPGALALAAKARARLGPDEEWLMDYERAHQSPSPPSRHSQQESGFERRPAITSPAPKEVTKQTSTVVTSSPPKKKRFTWGLTWPSKDKQRLPKAGSATKMERV